MRQRKSLSPSRRTRLRHWFGLDCNPLRRHSDVAESVVRLTGVILLAVSIPPALALSVSAESQPSTGPGHVVPAIVDESHGATPVTLGSPPPRARVRAHWVAPAGTSMHGQIWVTTPVDKGDKVLVDVAADGRVAQPAPLRWSGSSAGWLLVVALAGLWALGLVITELVLSSVRRRYWTRQWSVFCAGQHRHSQP